MRRTVRILLCAGLLAAAGCGDGDDEPRPRAATPTPTASPAATRAGGASISIEDIERRNARARRRAAARATPTPQPSRVAVPVEGSSRKPAITAAFLPFPAERKQQMAAYAQRHYDFSDFRLRDPQVIVQHYTATATAADAIAIFERNTPDPELGELPGTCTHFIVDTDGTILQLVPLGIMCRHTVGLNYTAIGIEHVGSSDAQVLGNRAQMRASLGLTRWLMDRFGIVTENVIGHNENRESPFHRERVAALRDQTHQDFTAASMAVYRGRL